MGFSYLCILLFIFIFILYLLKRNKEVAPKKIKRVLFIALTTLLARYAILILGFIIEKQWVIYATSFLGFLNYFSLPLVIIVLIFIFMRNEKVDFDICYGFIILLMVFYVYTVSKNKISIDINSIFGFVMHISESITPVLIYLIVLSSLCVFTLMFVDKPYNNKWGMRLLLFTIIMYIIEIILFLGGIIIFPYPLLGELLILLVLLKAIKTFKLGK